MMDKEKIQELIDSSDLFLFMKGTPDKPRCGFSARMVAILDKVDAEYKYLDVLDEDDIRDELKEISGWPTYPQLYVKGEILGGSDVIYQLYQKGELKKELGMDQ